jgi:predicted aspartyl protease
LSEQIQEVIFTGHVYADITVKGAAGEASLKNVIVDTGASYTTLGKDVVERIGAWSIPYTVDLELGDGRLVKADVYALIVSLGDRSAATLVACFEGAKAVLGVRTLEDLGLKVDPISGKLEASRPRNVAYFYRGEGTRDFTYVEDIVDGTLRMGVIEEAVGEAINLASETETRVIELANWINEMTGNNSGIVYEQRRDWDKAIRRRASIEKARRILGYEPKTDMKTGLRRVYEWIRENKDRIEACVRF